MIEALDNGSSNFTEKQIEDILDTINKTTNTENKLSKEQACKYLHISRATFDNYVRAGLIPEGIKEVGFKEKFWTLRTLNKFNDERIR